MKTVSLEIAKQLKEAGYPEIDNEFYWVQYISEFRDSAKYFLTSRKEYLAGRTDYFISPIAAPTADEILDFLPHQLLIKDKLYRLKIIKISGWTWGVGYETNDKSKTLHAEIQDTLVEAVAQTWLYLKKENLI